MSNISKTGNLSSDIPVASFPFLYSWITATALISTIGALTGIVLIVVILTQSTEKLRSSLLICQLLFLDLLNVAIFSPLDNTAILTTQLGSVGVINCRLLGYFRTANISAAYWTAAMLAWNRFTASYFPFRYKDVFRLRNTVITMTFSLLFPAILNSLIVAKIAGRFWPLSPSGHCTVTPVKAMSSLYDFISIMSGPFPLALQGVGYVLVAAHLWKKGHVHSDHHETNEKRKRQVTLARLLIVAYVWNLACFMPVPVFHTAFPLFWNGHEIILLCLRTLELCGSAGTPVIFLLLGTEYQTGFKAIFSKLH